MNNMSADSNGLWRYNFDQDLGRFEVTPWT